jgi:hypothetical protein
MSASLEKRIVADAQEEAVAESDALLDAVRRTSSTDKDDAKASGRRSTHASNSVAKSTASAKTRKVINITFNLNLFLV